MSDVPEELIANARELVSALAKGKKNLRMYPPNNPIYARTLQDVAARIGLCVQSEDLSLKVHQYELLVADVPVYQSTEKEDNLALNFFKDGLREITFRQGITGEEVEEFMKILAIDFDREALEDDIVTLLWEREFEHIGYRADEEFILVDQDYEEEAVGQVLEDAADTDRKERAHQDAVAAEAQEEPQKQPVKGTGQIMEMGPGELESLAERLEREELTRVSKMLRIYVELLYESKDVANFEEVAGFLEGTLRYCVNRGDFKAGTQILGLVQSIADSAAFSPDHKKHLRRISSYAGGRDIIGELRDLLDMEAMIDGPSFSAFLGALDPRTIPAFLALLGELKSIHGRRVMIEGLVALGRKDVDTIGKGLRDERWFLVRNTIMILGRIGDKRAIELLRNSLGHSDERVRKEVVKALGSIGGTTILPQLREALSDPSPAVRSIAARAFADFRGSTVAKKILLDEISKRTFAKKDLQEKKSFFEALAAWRDDEVYALMKDNLSRRSLLFKGNQDENRAAAAYALMLMGRDADVATLTSDGRTPMIDEAIKEARLKRAEKPGVQN